MRTFFFYSLIFLNACAHSSLSERGMATQYQPPCKITDDEKNILLGLDYHAFDQSLPDRGWRKYGMCFELSRDLLDQYVQLHSSTLLNWQESVLIWHSGQMSAMVGDYPRAVSQFEQTYRHDEKPTERILWNPYVDATIAFLKKDKAKLIEAQKQLNAGSSDNEPNIRVVNSFVRCFNSSYVEAYSQNCKGGE